MTVRENVEMALLAHARMDRDWIERDAPARREAADAHPRARRRRRACRLRIAQR